MNANMNISLFGERLKKRRKELDMSLEDVAQKAGMNKSTVFKYENGATDKIGIKYVAPLAKALQCSPTYLLGYESADMYKAVSEFSLKVPLYTPISCGVGSFVEENIIDYIAVPSENLNRSAEYFAQIACGDSMKDAGIFNGDTLIFQKSSTIASGQIGCFCIDESEAVCKKYKVVGSQIMLISMNDSYKPIVIDPMNANFKCVGILKKVIKDF